MKISELLDLVVEMRNAQREFFKNRLSDSRQIYLFKAKELEGKVDTQLEIKIHELKEEQKEGLKEEGIEL